MVKIRNYWKLNKDLLFKTILVVLCYFGPCLYLSFATDTYVVFSTGFIGAGIDMLIRNGRPVIGLFYVLFDLMGLSHENIYRVSAALSLVFLFLAIYLFSDYLKKYVESENVRIIISFISVANVYIIEYFMFIEKCGFMLAILFNILAVRKIDAFLNKREHKQLIKATIFVLVAALTYQGTIALYIILCLPLIFKYADSVKKYFINLFYLIIPYGFAGLIMVILFLITGSKRSNISKGVVANIKHAIGALYHFMSDTFDVMPSMLMGVLFIIVFIAAFYTAMNHEDRNFRIIHILVMFIVAVAFSLASLLQGSGWNAMRVVYPLASIIGMFTLDISINSKSCVREKTSNIRGAVTCVLIVIMFFQYLSFTNIFLDKNNNNMADMVRVQFIGNEIRQYELETGNKVSSIALYYDSEPSYPAYPGLYYSRDMIVSLFYTDWSYIPGINYYLNADYKKVDPVEKYEDYFKEKNWDGISSEQFIFEGNTLHICNY